MTPYRIRKPNRVSRPDRCIQAGTATTYPQVNTAKQAERRNRWATAELAPATRTR